MLVSMRTRSTCDTVIAIGNVIVFKENISTTDVKSIRIKRENAWSLREGQGTIGAGATMVTYLSCLAYIQVIRGINVIIVYNE
jgi:hypothetical protein